MTKSFIHLLAIWFIPLALWAQDDVLNVPPSIQKIYDIDTIDYTFEHPYRIFIAKPKQSANQHLLVILDGNAHFPIALQHINPTKSLPYIIGIGYPTQQNYAIAERERDYTFAANTTTQHGGQAQSFLQHLQHDIFPDIQRRYPISTAHKTFFGHSHGGLFGLYILTKQPQLFDYYVIVSPSLWWNNGQLLQQMNFSAIPSQTQILLTLGEYEKNPQLDNGIDPQRLQRIIQRNNYTYLLNLQSLFRQHHINSQFIILAKATHGSSIEKAISLTLQHIQ